MQFIDLLRVESQSELKKIVATACISGLANALILSTINTASKVEVNDESTFKYLLMFIGGLGLFIYCLNYTYEKSSQYFETILHKYKTRVAKKIRRSELQVIDAIGREFIYNRLVQETEVISQSQQMLVGALQAAAMVVFSSIYIAWVSLPAFVIIVAMTSGLVIVYRIRAKTTLGFIKKTTEKEVELLTCISNLLNGFKQVKVREKLGMALVDDIDNISDEVRVLKNRSSKMHNINSISAQSFFYVLIATIVFILPRFIDSYDDSIHALTASILFLIGPLSLVVTALPTLEQANNAARNMVKLEEKLLRDSVSLTDANGESTSFDFRKITLNNIEFDHFDENKNSTFHLGPVSLALIPGKITFVVGGNGSGKSTFLKLLTGLWFPNRGNIEVDEHRISSNNLQNYRELFSIIFNDFQLFNKLYAMPDVTRENVLRLLQKMKIDDVVTFNDYEFSTLELSTGQRKRLALLIALLEDRPIYVFDEWAADQDPAFRKYFYTTILPELARKGKIIVAVTHDDHYFYMADKLIKFDYGRAVDMEKPSSFANSVESSCT